MRLFKPLLLLVTFLFTIGNCFAIEGASSLPANSDPMYQALRREGFSKDAISVKELVLKRDAGTFTLHSGRFYFVTPVNGKVTGAVFVGQGQFSMVPPTGSERRSLKLLTREEKIIETFEEAVFRFTDDTEHEIKGAQGAEKVEVAYEGGYFGDVTNDLKKKLHYNLDGRILQDVMSPQPGGLFVAFIKGKQYSGKMIYAVDPHGVDNYLSPSVAPEEIALFTYDDNKSGIWAAFHYASEIASGTALSSQQNRLIHIQHHILDTQIEKSGYLNGNSITTIQSQAEGLRVVPLALFPSLRVKSVSDASGQPLAFIQEEKKEDPDFYVILPKEVNKGESYVIHTVYGGKEAVENTGGGNYYPVTRSEWYPNSTFGDYATYEMTFRIPKGMTMVATGTPVNESTNGSETITQWRSDAPLAVAGFNFGRFKHEQLKLEKPEYEVNSYANVDDPDIIKSLKRVAEGDQQFGGSMYGSGNGGRAVAALGSMDTTQMMKKALGEGNLSIQLYTDYFGPTSFKALSMTQQTAVNYGQSWPGLVYMPITAFFDETVRHQLGIGNVETRGYFRVVGPHEVAHQWWGHTVGFESYRDQWISEGFADFSAALFLQKFYGMGKFLEFWKDERELITETDKEGFRSIDAGPVTQGYRAGNTKTGWDIPRKLIYPKGAFILHMIRMMMFDQKTGDDNFKAMMRDFVDTYRNKISTTEDLKTMVEKHMTPAMNLDGNHKMDWFFDEYVYGTALPHYSLQSSFTNNANGTVLNLKLVQSGVDDKFKMLVPLYLEFDGGKMIRMGSAPIIGNRTIEQQIPLGKLPQSPKRAVVNYLYDVLSAEGS